MVALARFNFGESPISSAKLNAVIDTLTGAANTPVSLTGVNDPINYTLAIRNQDTAGKGLVVYAADGATVLLQVQNSGVRASAAGGAALSVVTTDDAQTLSNKALIAPVVNSGGLTVTAGGLTVTAGGLTVMAGGLTVTAGNVGIGGSPQTAQALTIAQGVLGANAYGIRHAGGLTATATNATLASVSLEPSMNPNGQTNVLEAGLLVATWNAANSANAYAAKLTAPTGSSGVNEALNASGAVTLVGLGAFAAGDKYLVIDASGHLHISALGPAS